MEKFRKMIKLNEIYVICNGDDGWDEKAKRFTSNVYHWKYYSTHKEALKELEKMLNDELCDLHSSVNYIYDLFEIKQFYSLKIKS
jgi:hypothetical protein